MNSLFVLASALLTARDDNAHVSLWPRGAAFTGVRAYDVQCLEMNNKDSSGSSSAISYQ